MGLRARLIPIVLIATLAYLVGSYALSEFVLLPNLERMEHDQAIKDLNRCYSALMREVEVLDNFNGDWSNWDETYEFAQGLSPDYIDDNLTSEMYDYRHFDLFLIYDLQGQRLAGNARDPETLEFVEMAEFPAELQEGHFLRHPADSLDSRTGLMRTSRGPMMISSRPILTNEAEGPAMGTIMIGRFLDKEWSEQLAKQTHVPMDIVDLHSGTIPDHEIGTLATIRETDNRIIEIFSDEFHHGHEVLDDMQGEPLLMIRAHLPRNITQQGREVIHTINAAALVGTLLVLALLLVLLGRVVVRPIRQVSGQMALIAESNDLSSRVGLTRKDEVGQLSRQFDHLLDTIQHSRDDLTAAKNQIEQDVVMYRESQEALQERVKEMTCLQQVRNSLQPGLSVEQICPSTLEHLVRGMRYPDITAAVITLDDQRFIAGGSEEGLTHGLHADIVVAGSVCGRLSVFYTENRPFLLPEEQGLIDAVAKILGHWLDRLQAEEALRESNKRFMDILYSSDDAILIIDDERFVDCNAATAQMLGCSGRDEVLMTHPSELSPPRQPDGRDSFEKANEMMRRAFDKGFHRFEWSHRRANGEDFPVEVSLTPIYYDGKTVLHCLWRDITEQKRTAEALQHAKDTAQREASKLSAMISGMEEGVIFADSDNCIMEANEFFCQLMKTSRDRLIGAKIEEFHRGDILSRVMERIADFRATPNAEAVILQRTLGQTHVILRVQPICRHGEYDGILLNVIDVTELVNARQEAEEASAAKSEFLANMSHEIRTPMTAILGFTDQIKEANCTPTERDEYLDIIQNSGYHLLHLINDILDLSKIEAGKFTIERCPMDLLSMISEVASIMRVRAIDKGLTLDLEFPTALPSQILSDPSRLRQALINLVANAIKFTSQGSVRVRTRFLPQWQDQGPMIQIDVIDTGIGIPSEKFEELFDPFSQADSSTSRKYGGTGLGLTISRNICHLLGGELSIQSVVGQGSEFTLVIPTGSLDDVTMIDEPRESFFSTTVSTTKEFGTDEPLAGRRILLAEDGQDNQLLIRALLTKAGAVVEIAEDGQVAVERVEELAPDRFDMILMDMQMPRLDGYEATRILRAWAYTGPIIALTAHAMAGDRSKCIEAGCNDYCTKPIDRVKLIRAIQSLCPSPSNPADPTPTAEDDTSPIRSELADDETISGILGAFVDGLLEKIQDMRKALDASAMEDLERFAHQLKGSGGGYGYPMLTEAAEALESAAKVQDVEAMESGLVVLERLCERVVAGYPGAMGGRGDES
jgi:PAS domain S-box-containing protein